MKKTFITIALFTAGEVALAAAPESVLDKAYIGFSDFSATTKVADYGTMVDDITISTTGSVTSLTGVTFDTAISTTNTRDCFSITLVLDASKIGAVSDFSSLAAAYYSQNGAMGFGVNSSGKLSGQWGTGEWIKDNVKQWEIANFPSTGTITLTFVTGGYDGSTEGARLYVNNATAFYSNNSLKSGGSTYNTVKINNLNNAVQQVYVHNYSLSAAEVGTLMTEIAAIPEPTTATLSLLALAGLAARRRRR